MSGGGGGGSIANKGIKHKPWEEGFSRAMIKTLKCSSPTRMFYAAISPHSGRIGCGRCRGQWSSQTSRLLSSYPQPTLGPECCVAWGFGGVSSTLLVSASSFPVRWTLPTADFPRRTSLVPLLNAVCNGGDQRPPAHECSPLC